MPRPAFWKRAPGENSPHKYRAKACWVTRDLTLYEEEKIGPEVKEWLKRERKGDAEAAIRFSSKREAKRYVALAQMLRAGVIRDLRRQVPFELQARRPDGLMQNVVSYRADFVYFDVDRGHEIVEDSKGFPTPEYELKKKWFAVQFGREIQEV
jgi:hypothetical protein